MGGRLAGPHWSISLVLQRRFLKLVGFLAGNRFPEGRATKLASAWAGRHEEVLKVPFLRTVVVILDAKGISPNAGLGAGEPAELQPELQC